MKDVAIPRRPQPKEVSNSISPARPQLPREHISFANKRLLRERRMEALDFYQRQIDSQNRLRNNSGSSFAGHAPVVHKSTLQLRLLDTSRVVSEHIIYKIKHQHEMDYSVLPLPLSFYSLVTGPNSLLLFGGLVVDQQKEVETVSNKLYMIVSKPEVKLY